MSVQTITKLSHDEMKASVDNLLNEIINGDDTHWQTYMNELASEVAAGLRVGIFKPWSAHNRMSLRTQARQRGENVHGIYAGVDQWRKRDREIREGEQPYFIYGSPVVTKTEKNEDGSEEVTQRWRKPPLLPVYDYSQTFSTDPAFVEPNWEVPLAGGNLDTLHKLAATSPVPVRFQPLGSHKARGWLNKDGITVDSSQPITNQIWTLVHELAHHHLGHLKDLGTTHDPTAKTQVRERAEQEAACVQYLVFKMLGLDENSGTDITKAAGMYLRSWVKTNSDGTERPIAGPKGRRRLLKQRFKDTLTAAQAIAESFAKQPDEVPPAG